MVKHLKKFDEFVLKKVLDEFVLILISYGTNESYTKQVNIYVYIIGQLSRQVVQTV